MKPPHELDERMVVAESVGPRAMEGHHQECPWRPPPWPSAAPNSGMLSWRTNPPRRNWTVPGSSYLVITWLREPESHQPSGLVLRQPSRCSGPLLKVKPEVFGRALLGALMETVGEGDKFLRLDRQKMTLPSSTLRLVR
ncbi:hypothetical protein GOBAR_AA07124 [Gossypium barbadense]|uniref:Uncharacterized protein n=1 Tax=Gossypium barbadense TaxID=3634 RepID=A0A2P5YCX8_GOSBA|nr:hypothetical protein GOBAR_AA07124 [Gossypium barbadense]